MDPGLAAAVIAVLVSLVISSITLWLVHRERDEGGRDWRRALQARLTEKLYDLRVQHYPEAFAILQGIHGGVLLKQQLTPADLQGVREALSEWTGGEASFALSRGSLEAYYALRDALLVAPEEDAGYSEAQQQAMWLAKNAFRDRLRRDVQWLFREDEQESKRRTRWSKKREKTSSQREKTSSQREKSSARRG